MITQEAFYGGASRIVLDGADKNLNPRHARVVRVDIGSGIAGVRLPDTQTYRRGGPHLLVVNATGVALPLKDQSGTLIVNIPIGNACVVTLFDNTTANGLWGTEFAVWGSA